MKTQQVFDSHCFTCSISFLPYRVMKEHDVSFKGDICFTTCYFEIMFPAKQSNQNSIPKFMQKNSALHMVNLFTMFKNEKNTCALTK